MLSLQPYSESDVAIAAPVFVEAGVEAFSPQLVNSPPVVTSEIEDRRARSSLFMVGVWLVRPDPLVLWMTTTSLSPSCQLIGNRGVDTPSSLAFHASFSVEAAASKLLGLLATLPPP